MRAEPTRRFKPYPAYRDSGVEWPGEIPAHWKLKQFQEYRTATISAAVTGRVDGREGIP